jgi:hypothetical protein
VLPYRAAHHLTIKHTWPGLACALAWPGLCPGPVAHLSLPYPVMPAYTALCPVLCCALAVLLTCPCPAMCSTCPALSCPALVLCLIVRWCAALIAHLAWPGMCLGLAWPVPWPCCPPILSSLSLPYRVLPACRAPCLVLWCALAMSVLALSCPACLTLLLTCPCPALPCPAVCSTYHVLHPACMQSTTHMPCVRVLNCEVVCWPVLWPGLFLGPVACLSLP